MRVIRYSIFTVLVAASLVSSILTITSGSENLPLAAATAFLAALSFPQIYEWLNDRLGPARDLRLKESVRRTTPGTVEEYLRSWLRGDDDQNRRNGVSFIPLTFAVGLEGSQNISELTNDLYRIFDDNPRGFVLIGDPGAGKSMSLRYLMRRAIYRYLSNPKDYPFPVWINLGEGANPTKVYQPDSDAPMLLRHWWDKRCYLPDTPDRAIRQHSLLLFLDGLNEMPLDSRRDRAEALRNFLQQNQEVQTVVTCRIGDYKHDEALKLPLPVVRVLPLSDTCIPEFITRNGGDVELWDAIRADDALRTLAANPYSLYQLIQVSRDSRRQGEIEPLPRDLTALYPRYLRVTYDHYTSERQQQRDAQTPLLKLSLKQLEKRLGRLSFAMLAEGKGTSADLEWALHWPRRWRWGVQALRDGQNLGVLLRDGENMRFYHPSLLGYFAIEPLRTAILARRYFRRCNKNAVELIRQIGYLGLAGSPATGLLVDALESPDGMTRVAATYSLNMIGEPVVEPLTRVLVDRSWPHLEYPWEANAQRKMVIQMIARLGDPAVRPLIHLLVACDSPVRDMAAAVLGQVGKPAVASLLNTLAHPDKDVRSLVTNVLCIIADPRAALPLVASLNDPDRDVRAGAALALGAIADPQAVEPLIRALEDPYETVRIYASVALGEIGNPSAADALIRALDDPHPDVSLEAGLALGRIRDPHAVEPLVRTLGHPSFEIQQKAVDLLSDMGESAIDPLINALSNPDFHIILNAFTALTLMSTDPRAKAVVERMAAEYPDIAHAGKFGAALHIKARRFADGIAALNERRDRLSG